ncbi:MAG TPA: hypothetical protein VHB97_25130 [Polyangia bacterium]|nr:hypothetical protein [Polyangia bacterium]
MCLTLLLGTVGPAAAADSPEGSAKFHFEEGTKAFNLGEFKHAVDEYRAAYKPKPDPVFLYNIAQAYRLAGDLTQALFFYESYLRNEPNAPNLREVDRRVHELEVELERQKSRGAVGESARRAAQLRGQRRVRGGQRRHLDRHDRTEQHQHDRLHRLE